MSLKDFEDNNKNIRRNFISKDTRIGSGHCLRFDIPGGMKQKGLPLKVSYCTTSTSNLLLTY